MKMLDYCRFLLLVCLCLTLSLPGFAQKAGKHKTNSPESPLNLSIRDAFHPTADMKKARVTTPTVALDCSNDQTAPEIHCPAGACWPNARAAYLISQYGEPWGRYDNVYAMDAVFGSGNWDALVMENADPSVLLSPAYKVLFLEGSDPGGYVLDAFLQANLPALEAWVAAGGALFINCAPNSAPSTMSLGFGGVTLNAFQYSDECHVQAPEHPIFSGPFAPANGPFSGRYFHLATLSGNVGQVLLTGSDIDETCLAVKSWGAGTVFFSTMIFPSWLDPYPNVQNMWWNIPAFLNAQWDKGLPIPADAGACFATITDQIADATATDDCALASLTHDFPGAASNTTLTGTVLPAGRTLVRWTATDASGNTSTCETTLFVQEPEAPGITCPEDMTVPVNDVNCSAVVSFAATATDNCTPEPTLAYFPLSGSTFNYGGTVVTATATDVSGNQTSCTFVVNVVPGPELCNGIDDDCNGLVDDGAPGDNVFYADFDYDGYGDPNNSITVCAAPYGYVDNALDCDDNNYYIQPGMYEICNGVDDNCDGQIDEGYVWFADADGDGYGDAKTAQAGCDQPQGFVFNSLDCDDTNAYIHPGAMEDCTNQVDENCDGILGENNFTINEVHTDVFCGSSPDGSIDLTVLPVQNYPVILWSNGTCCTTSLTNLQDGAYTVTVTNECGTSKTKTIVIQPSSTPALQVSLTGSTVICGGAADGFINAAASDGCGTYTYEWNTGEKVAALSGLSGGYYAVTVTDACGCTRSAEFIIQEPYPLGVYPNLTIQLLDGTYFVQVYPYGGTAPYQFRRNTPPAGYTPWTASNGFLGVAPGEYIFEIQDNTGCTAQTTIFLDYFSTKPANRADNGAEAQVLSTDPNTQPNAVLNTAEPVKLAVTLAPNPNTGTFAVDMLEPAAQAMVLAVTDSNGKLLFSQTMEAGIQTETVHAESLPAGIYFLQVVADGRVIGVEKFVKQ